MIVEVRARGEQLDRFEAVRGDVDQVLAAQPMLVEQVRGDAEAVHSTNLNPTPTPSPARPRRVGTLAWWEFSK